MKTKAEEGVERKEGGGRVLAKDIPESGKRGHPIRPIVDRKRVCTECYCSA